MSQQEERENEKDREGERDRQSGDGECERAERGLPRAVGRSKVLLAVDGKDIAAIGARIHMLSPYIAVPIAIGVATKRVIEPAGSTSPKVTVTAPKVRRRILARSTRAAEGACIA